MNIFRLLTGAWLGLASFMAFAQDAPFPEAEIVSPAQPSFKSMTGLIELNADSAAAFTELNVPFHGRSVRILIQTTDPSFAKSAGEAVAFEASRIERLTEQWKLQEIRKVNEAAGNAAVVVGPDVFFLAKEALKVSRLTKGGFDLTDTPLQELWGSGSEARQPDPKEIKKTLPVVDFEKLDIDAKDRSLKLKKKGMKLGLKGMPKAYLLDRLRDILRRYGFASFALGIDEIWMVQTVGEKPYWSLTVQNSGEKKTTVVTPVLRAAISVVEGQGRDPGEVLIDPTTGYPPDHLNSVVLLANYSHWAYSLSQGIYSMDPKQAVLLLQLLEEAEGITVGRDGEIEVSKGLKKQIKKQIPVSGK